MLYNIAFIEKNICVGDLNSKFIIVNCCRKASINLNRYSEVVHYTNISGDMGKIDNNGIRIHNHLVRKQTLNH